MKATLLFGLEAYLTNLVYAQSETPLEYNYAYNGADWPALFPACGGLNQSPIDLKGHLKVGFPLYKAAKDRLNKIYTDQVDDIAVNWNGNSLEIAINKEGQNV